MMKMTRREKREVYSGKKALLFEKMGIMEEDDIEKLKEQLYADI